VKIRSNYPSVSAATETGKCELNRQAAKAPRQEQAVNGVLVVAAGAEKRAIYSAKKMKCESISLPTPANRYITLPHLYFSWRFGGLAVQSHFPGFGRGHFFHCSDLTNAS
jgi:hypothetical protein